MDISHCSDSVLWRLIEIGKEPILAPFVESNLEMSSSVHVKLADRSLLVKAGVAALAATTASFGAHVWLLHWSEEAVVYDWGIVSLAYATLLLQTLFLVFLYYHSSHLIPWRKKLPRALFVTAVVLGIQGELVRQPLMNFVCSLHLGWKEALCCSFVHQLSIWIPRLVFCTIIVFTIPQKHELS